jgi:hypothetical protein
MNCCNPPQHVPSLLGGAENMKLLFDSEMSVLQLLANNAQTLNHQGNVNNQSVAQQASLDNQEDARAWSALKLRLAQNAATLDHLAAMNNLAQAQVGTTESQQTVSPAGTAESEANKGAVGAAMAGQAVNAEAVTANVVNLFTSLTPVIASALAAAISQTIAALVPVVVASGGTASGSAQPKPAPAPAPAA